MYVPVEIIYLICEYLDLHDVLQLQTVNKFMFFLLKPFIKVQTLMYMRSCDIFGVDFTELNEISQTVLVNMLFFIRKCVLEDMGKVTTINIISTYCGMEPPRKFRSSLYSNLYQSTCNYNIDISLFQTVDFDAIERCILKSSILDNVFVKQQYNIYNIVKKICLYRIDYKSVFESEIPYYGGISKYHDKRKLNMVTFYFFI